LAEVLLEAGYRVTGIDISDAMLDQARARLARFGTSFACKLADARELSPPEKPFAAAVCARVLMHFPLEQQVEFLRGVVRQCNGPVVFSHSYDSRYQRARRRLKKLLRHREPVAVPLNEAAIGRLLESSGLRELRRIWLAPLVSEAFYLVATRR
jgi:ubiquinone/menaquinone biosynthesis C-methylase UbiE